MNIRKIGLSIHAALYYFILLVVQFKFEFVEFKFELKCLDPFSKMENFSFSLTLFSPTSPTSPLPPSFLFSFPWPKTSPPAHCPLLARSALPSLCRRQVGPTCRGHPRARDELGLLAESGCARPSWPTGQGERSPLYIAPHPLPLACL